MVALTAQMIRGKTRLENLDDVRNLNLWGQDLDDVSLLAQLPQVEILSFSVNRISSLREFRHCAGLQELYLRKNEVAEISELQYLKALPNLKVLWLSDNPIADYPFYRQLAIRMLPHLEKLDSTEVSDMERSDADQNPELDAYLGRRPERPSSSAPPGPSAAAAPTFAAPPAPRHTPSASSSPSRAGGRTPISGYHDGGGGGGGGGGQRTKNILYAVMALMPELDMDDLVYVKREIEQRLGMGPDAAAGGVAFGSPSRVDVSGGSGRRRTPPRDSRMDNGY